MRRSWWLLGVLVLGAACSTTSTCPNSPLLYVDLPGGTDSISSLTVVGACGPIPGGCVPVAASCQTAGCECRITLQVNPSTFDASPDGICDIRATSKDGGLFSKTLAFNSKGGACFDVTGPIGTVVFVQFSSPAGGADADASGADAAPDGDAGALGTDADASPGDAG
jgi:hypothetical protein